jgi:hypothetical protein
MLRGRQVRVRTRKGSYGTRYVIEVRMKNGWCWLKECDSHEECRAFLAGRSVHVDALTVSL